MNKHPLDSFRDFLKNKYPDICTECLGEGKLECQGRFMKFPVECPICNGTGKETKK